MPTGAKSAYNTLLKRGDGGGPEVFTAIAEITKITPNEQTRDVVEATTMDSASGVREYIAGLIEPGEVSLEGNYTSVATQDSLRTDFAAGTLRNFKIEYPLASTETHAFAAIVTKYGIGDVDPSGKVSFKATLKISGPVTVS